MLRCFSLTCELIRRNGRVSRPHLGYVANAFGSCCKRIWVMLQTHLGGLDNFRVTETVTLLRGNEGAAVYISESGLYLRGSGYRL